MTEELFAIFKKEVESHQAEYETGIEQNIFKYLKQSLIENLNNPMKRGFDKKEHLRGGEVFLQEINKLQERIPESVPDLQNTVIDFAKIHAFSIIVTLTYKAKNAGVTGWWVDYDAVEKIAIEKQGDKVSLNKVLTLMPSISRQGNKIIFQKINVGRHIEFIKAYAPSYYKPRFLLTYFAFVATSMTQDAKEMVLGRLFAIDDLIWTLLFSLYLDVGFKVHLLTLGENILHLGLFREVLYPLVEKKVKENLRISPEFYKISLEHLLTIRPNIGIDIDNETLDIKFNSELVNNYVEKYMNTYKLLIHVQEEEEVKEEGKEEEKNVGEAKYE